MSEPDRAEAMGRRLDRTAQRLGLSSEDRALLLGGYRKVMEPRRARIREDHHPDYLHPARTALILMDDTGEREPATLLAALFAETRDPTLLPPAEALERVSPEAARLAAHIPVPDREPHLLEALLALPVPGARVAAAERLDHARHLHIREQVEWRPWHRTTRESYVPATRRVDPRLAGRLDWWCDMFDRRFLQG